MPAPTDFSAPVLAPSHEVFLSYSSKDAQRVLAIVKLLKQAGVTVWRDGEQILGGQYYGEQIANAIKSSQVVLLMCSPEALASDNIHREIVLSWEHAHRRIIPIWITEPVTIPARFLYCLTGLQWIDAHSHPSEVWFPRLLDALHTHGAGLNTPTGDRDESAPALSDDRPAPTVGSRIDGYEILAELGRGGMGVVYKARDLRLNRLVALKMIRSAHLASAAERDRFRTEAEAAARIQHPLVVPVYASGEFDGCPYFVCEYIEGGSLKEKVAGMPQSAGDAARLVLLLARGVQAIHQHQIIHRDLKPANVLLAPPGDEPGLNTPYGIPKVADFGLAKCLDRNRDGTASGAVMGTPYYMAPEQASGESKRMGPATDVYALGVILYELLTGRVPIRGQSDLDTLTKIVTEPVPPPRTLRSDVPVGLEAICLRCLQKKPEDRYPTAQALAHALNHFLSGDTMAAPSPIPRPPKPRRKWRVVALGSIAAVVLIALGLWGLSTLGHQPPTNTGLEQAAQPQTAVGTSRATVPPLKGYVDVKVSKTKDEPARFLKEPGVLPLHAGEWMRIEAQLTRPAYLYVVWLESSGRAVPKYPWEDNDWSRRPAEEKPLTDWSFPPGEGMKAPLDPTPPGVEAVLLLVRESVLPADEDAALAKLFEGLPKQNQLEDRRLRVWLENGEIVEDRGSPNLAKAEQARDLLSRTQALLSGPLKKRFSYTRAVCYGFAGD